MKEINFKLRPRLILGSIGVAFLISTGFAISRYSLDWFSFIIGIKAIVGVILFWKFNPFDGNNPNRTT